jgi:glucose/arabinose dehydrogenase
VKALRVVRFTEASNVGTNPKLIFNQIYVSSNTNHVGGIIRFRPSQPTKLYIQIGELAYEQTDPSKNYANKLNNPYGKILRINTDGTIPTDNPFYDDGNPATGKDDRIWCLGQRNGYGMCFNPVTDSMYSSENGLNAWDEFNIIHKGGNYGWATCEGNHKNSSTSQLCNDPSLINPMTTWGAPLPSVTGCLFYSGTVLPEFNNHILVADNDYGIIYDLTLGNPPAYDVVTNKKSFADIVSGSDGTGLTTIRQGSDGCIYALKGGYTTSGQIYRICLKTTGIEANNEPVNELGQNYPNPASGKTQMDYSIKQSSSVQVVLLDVTGRVIRTLLDEYVQAGTHTLEVNELSSLPNGSYFYRMNVVQNNKIGFSQTKKLVVLN